MTDFFLTPQQRQYFTSLLNEKTPKPLYHRAQILTLYAEGWPTHKIAEQVGLTSSAVRYWRARFRQEGMSLFPDYPGDSSFAATSAAETAVPSDTSPEEEKFSETGPKESEPELPEEPEFKRSKIDPAEIQRMQHISEQALVIFDHTRSLHRLPEQYRRLLKQVGSLPIFRTQKSIRKTLAAAQQWIDQHLSEDLPTEHERSLLIAMLTAPHGKKKLQSLENLGLDPEENRQALLLASILRIARGLDNSRSQSTQFQTAERLPGRIRLIVSGPQAAEDAAAAQRYTSGWERNSDYRLEIMEAAQAEKLRSTEPALPHPLNKTGISPDDPMSEAGRKVLLYHFAEMIAHEEGTRLGEDIEELHDMRVASRRMRAAFEVFGEAFEPKVLKSHLKGLKATGRALGRVRDLDVFMEKAQHYLEGLPESERSGLDPLLHGWQAEREQARTEMNAYLESEAYQEFKLKFNHFLQTPGEGALAVPQDQPTPYLVREIAPVLIYNRLAAVRAYASVLAHASIDQMHALRIEYKKLRYTVEYFREVLGGQSKEVINDIKKLQDHLGDLNDADVATEILRSFLDGWDARQAGQPVSERQNPEAIFGYLAAQHAERHRLMVTFQETWAFFLRPEFRQNLAMAIAVL
jgi:CHAD domain-containing protein/transposase-like protein